MSFLLSFASFPFVEMTHGHLICDLCASTVQTAASNANAEAVRQAQNQNLLANRAAFDRRHQLTQDPAPSNTAPQSPVSPSNTAAASGMPNGWGEDLAGLFTCFPGSTLSVFYFLLRNENHARWKNLLRGSQHQDHELE